MMGTGKNQQLEGAEKNRNADFMICNSCLWCASLLYSYYPTKCPSCTGTNVELIPIAKSESYLVSMDRTGISITFWNIPKLQIISQSIIAKPTTS
jgi:hypothetical protein